jgi:hypothetical protein
LLLCAQEAEEAGALEEFPHSSWNVHNPQSTVHGVRHVISADQLSHAGGVDAREAGQVENNRSFATTEKRQDLVA